MNVKGRHYRTIWHDELSPVIYIIDQRMLPHQFVVKELNSADDAVMALRDMQVRGAGLMGATAAYGMWLAAIEAGKSGSFDTSLLEAAERLKSARPTAVNPEWAVNRQLASIAGADTIPEKIDLAKETAIQIANEDAGWCRQLGLHGVELIEAISGSKQGKPVNILTHCNAGWLAFVDYGSATAPIYEAFERGISVHVWVDETRPRNQGASLTAWELLNHGVPHKVIADNTGGHLMQAGMVDMVITGADRVARNGDTANKIGTYLKALAAADNGIPFYVALPSSSFDWNLQEGLGHIPIEERSGDEVRYISGYCEGEIKSVLLTPYESPVANFGFDITPSRLIEGFITERGICKASETDLIRLFPEKKSHA